MMIGMIGTQGIWGGDANLFQETSKKLIAKNVRNYFENFDILGGNRNQR